MRTALLAALCLSLAAAADDDRVGDGKPDGLYVSAGDGGRLGDLSDLKPTRASVVSVDNFDAAFRVHLETAWEEEARKLALVVHGKAYDPVGWGGVRGTSRSYAFRVPGAAAATAAKLFGVKHRPRRHPGHRLAVRFRTARAVYAPGERVVATLEIRNVGEVAVHFAALDDARFAARHRGAPVALKHLAGLGGSAALVTIAPGASWKRSLKLGGVKLPVGYHHVTGSYELELLDGPVLRGTEYHEQLVWVEHVAARFAFEVRAPRAR